MQLSQPIFPWQCGMFLAVTFFICCRTFKTLCNILSLTHTYLSVQIHTYYIFPGRPISKALCPMQALNVTEYEMHNAKLGAPAVILLTTTANKVTGSFTTKQSIFLWP